jgi:hypothetical protein
MVRSIDRTIDRCRGNEITSFENSQPSVIQEEGEREIYDTILYYTIKNYDRSDCDDMPCFDSRFFSSVLFHFAFDFMFLCHTRSTRQVPGYLAAKDGKHSMTNIALHCIVSRSEVRVWKQTDLHRPSPIERLST